MVADFDISLLNGRAVPETVKQAFREVKDTAAAEAYTRQLAQSHYENFSVVSFLLPKRLHQDFYNIYAFCRTADDLGDEVGDKQLALTLLHHFKDQLEQCYAGGRPSVIFTALQSTIEKYDIPQRPFADLVDAFIQDQRMSRYDTFEQVVDYCTRSADPVGRLVLYMCGYQDEARQVLSDKTCTALQLANFWQDVRRDLLERDRVYLPRTSLDKFGVTIDDLRSGRVTDGYRAMIKFEVDRCQTLFDAGRELLPLLDGQYRRQIALFGKGGVAVLQAIRKQNYDTLTRRPSISKLQKGRLIAEALTVFMVQKLSRGSAA